MTGYNEIFERVEEKYLLDEWQFQDFRQYLEEHTQPGLFGRTRVMSLYYDTPSNEVVERSLEKPVYKEKLRVRSYGVPSDDGKVYVELKKKFKGVVYKRRIAMTLAASRLYLSGTPFAQANAEHPLTGEDAPDVISVGAIQTINEIDGFVARHPGLAPAMLISSVREEYLGSQNGLRITVDRDICWRNRGLDLALGLGGNQLINPSQCLMEVKCSGAYPFELVDALDFVDAYPQSFSKYGSAYLASTGRALELGEMALAAGRPTQAAPAQNLRGAHSRTHRVLQSA